MDSLDFNSLPTCAPTRNVKDSSVYHAYILTIFFFNQSYINNLLL